jgi:FG-GAP-like repeat
MHRWPILLILLLVPFCSFAQNWTEHTVATEFGAPHSVIPVDFNGDGYMDIVGSAGDAWDIKWWSNTDGTGLTWTEHLIDDDAQGCRGMTTGDFDADGDPDLIVTECMSFYSHIDRWENADGLGTSWLNEQLIEDNSGPYHASTADVDGDGDLDFFAAHSFDYDFVWWENVLGTGDVWTSHLIHDGLMMGAMYTFPADINGDGYVDLLVANSDYSDIVWFRNNDGTGLSWTEIIVDEEFSLATVIKASDIDGDGDLDVVATGTSNREVVFWSNDDGLGTSWTKNVIAITTHSVNHIAISDLDLDGDPDIIATIMQGISGIFWWQNVDGVGGTWEEGTISNSYSWAQWVEATDINGDGFPDLITCNTMNNEISWFENPWELGVDERQNPGRGLVTSFEMKSAYPNPFNPATTVEIHLPHAADLHLAAYNVAGQRVSTLWNGVHVAGIHHFTFDASKLGSGLYFLHASVPGEMSEVQKVMLVR